MRDYIRAYRWRNYGERWPIPTWAIAALGLGLLWAVLLWNTPTPGSRIYVQPITQGQ